MNNQIFNLRNPDTRFFAALLAFLSLVLVSSFVFGLKTKREDLSVPSGTASRSFPQVALKARAAYVYDIREGEVLFARNADAQLPLASLVKVMAALVATEIAPDNSVVWYRSERWPLADLLDFSLVSSSNEGMRAVALSLGALSEAGASPEEAVNSFVQEMNRKADELGLENTYFLNVTGLDESEGTAGAYGSAQDISRLMEYILINHPGLLAATREASATVASVDRHLYVANNTNRIVSEIPGLLASKTGLTDMAGGNLSVIFDPELGRPIIVTVLGSTEAGRFEDVRMLVNATMQYVTK